MTQILWDFKGKTALVTGGSRGVGQTVVRKLAQAGANVVFTYAENHDAANKVLKECGEQGFSVSTLRCDMASEVDVKRLLKQFGSPDSVPLDYVVHNAGITADAPVFKMSDQQWQDVIQVNLHSTYKLSQGLIRPLALTGGSMVNLSSVSGLVGIAGQANYSAAKAGIIGFTKALSKEVGSLGIRVNCVAPGYIETDMVKGIPAARRKELERGISLRRFGTTDEVADMIVFLLSDSASYITGEVFVVSGGLI